VILVVLVLLLVIIIGRPRLNKGDKPDDLDLRITIEDLDKLKKQISELEFEDIENLNVTTTLDFSSMNLDSLEAALQALSYDNLEGFIED
jgi:hypothetical protein